MKELISWKEEYSVGIQELDNQHKELINLINLLRTAMVENRNRDALDYATQKLLEYTLFHFTSEETLFKKYQYPEADSHKTEHGFFIQKISQYKKKFDQGEGRLEVSLEAFLKGWLNHHILEVDKKYGKFFKEKGINPGDSIPLDFNV